MAAFDHWARGLRAFADGYVSLLLPIYLIGLGLTPFQVGVIATATLLGSGALTLLVGWRANRFESRALLLAAAVLMCATGLGFATVTSFWPLVVIAVVGTLNPSSGDVSVFLPLEHAVLARVVADRERTATFARGWSISRNGAGSWSDRAGATRCCTRGVPWPLTCTGGDTQCISGAASGNRGGSFSSSRTTFGR